MVNHVCFDSCYVIEYLLMGLRCSITIIDSFICLISGSSFRSGIKAGFDQNLASSSSSSNNSLNALSLTCNLYGSDEVDSISLVAILHIMCLLCSSKTGKQDLESKRQFKVQSSVRL